ncbi:hypothetical protein ACFZAV_19750 [Streptomyces sp. NPDC008343]|uniref:hypothetical protein n=1 Tax=Streptomyces sp. NPDC008343 TaxID=3364828 RepID=UPI0036E8984F
MTAGPRPTRPDRLELGEGTRWTGSGIVLVDILAGRLLSAPDDPTAPLHTVAQLPVPLGAVAPLAGHAGTWIAAAGTGPPSQPRQGPLPAGTRRDHRASVRCGSRRGIRDGSR